jgi:ribosomal protein L9
MKKTPASVFLVITSAVAIDGELAKANSIVEVSDAEARNLLHRGKARLATEADGIEAAEVKADTEPDGEEATQQPAKNTKAKRKE